MARDRLEMHSQRVSEWLRRVLLRNYADQASAVESFPGEMSRHVADRKPALQASQAQSRAQAAVAGQQAVAAAIQRGAMSDAEAFEMMMGGPGHGDKDPTSGRVRPRSIGRRGEEAAFPPGGLEVQSLLQFPVNPQFASDPRYAQWGVMDLTYEHVDDEAKLNKFLQDFVSQRIAPQYKVQHEKQTLLELKHKVKGMLSFTFKRIVRIFVYLCVVCAAAVLRKGREEEGVSMNSKKINRKLIADIVAGEASNPSLL
jgi:hypothetical protein